MENISFSGNEDQPDSFPRNFFDSKLFPTGTRMKNHVLENILLSEGGEDFFLYLKSTGLSSEPDILVLSSLHHYYYDHSDLKDVGILVNLKKLNDIKHLESFLHTLFRLLPSGAHFIGCFRRGSRNEPVAHQSKFFNGLAGIFDTKAARNLSKRGVTSLLEEHGFRINDITETNGLTYFWAQNKREPGR